jgi:tetratricopeptide (TPR) repeat protein
MPEQQFTIPQAMQIAVKHHLANRLAEAEEIYRRILQMAPDHPYALHNLAAIACTYKQFAAALPLVKRAIELHPDDAGFYNTQAVALFACGREVESFECCKKGLSLDPNLADTHANLGICYADQGDLGASVAAFEKAIKIDPNHANAHDGLGLSLLMSGQLQRGWREQEWRWRKTVFEKQRFPDAPHWTGQDLAGRTLLLYVEQGYGDVLQFSRYAPLLKARGARVLLEAPPDLMAILRTLDGVAERVPVGKPPPPFDLACALMSVPLWFGTTLETIPVGVPYLHADAARVEEWKAFFGDDTTFKVGIAWAGRATHANDHNRSSTLANFAPLAEVPGVTFYSLQKDAGNRPASAVPAGMKLIDLAPRLSDFNVTAAVISNLDLVISVDTAIVHLAGAMGRPVWTLLARCPDWRWMLKRSDTPWYPTMRLFRQQRRRDWAGQMAQVAEALRSTVALRSSNGRSVDLDRLV